MGGRDGPEWLGTMARNQWARWTEIPKNQERVSNILNAGSCRELWIQGEMYLDDIPNMYISLKSKMFKLVDIHGKSGNSHPEMITEIKVISFRGFSRQDIFGHGGRADLLTHLNDCGRDFSRHDDKGEKLRHSIYKDYKKLKAIQKTNDEKEYTGEKYLLLVIPYHEKAHGSQGSTVDGDLKGALETIQIEGNANHWDWDFFGKNKQGVQELMFKIRLWRISNIPDRTNCY